MYLDRLDLTNLRTFKRAKLDFLNASRRFGNGQLPRPKLPNVNLLLGDNGSGKTTLLQAIALASLGPALEHSGVFVHSLVRRPAKGRRKTRGKAAGGATIEASFTVHEQDLKPTSGDSSIVQSLVTLGRRRDLETMTSKATPEAAWEHIFRAQSDAFFVVGYGATRRVEPGESLDMGARVKSRFERAQRVQGLFEDSHSLIPLSYWLPGLRRSNPGRYKQVVGLINKLLGRGHYSFAGDMQGSDYVFQRQGRNVPFQGLSDGYRAFLGWVADLLYHVCFGCPSGAKLIENRGIVMIDEIDLHLHPRWQLKVIPTVARALPNIQFIITSHSPLVAGSLEWMNIIHLAPGKSLPTRARRLDSSLSGLDADQVLVSEYFGLATTRTASKQNRIDALTLRAREGDSKAAKKLLKELTKGAEQGGGE
jgi:predicted ATPase